MKRREFLAAAACAAGIGAAPAQAQSFAVADLCVIDEQDRLRCIAEFRGRGLFLHWWGSWCPPCRREMPELAWLQAQYPADGPVAFVFMNAFEPVSKSRAWLQELGHSIALYDSGAVSRASRNLWFADGTTKTTNEMGIDLYPTTWIVDRGGTARRVVRGANPNWVSWKSFVDEIAAMPWDGKSVDPAAHGWAKGTWTSTLDGAQIAIDTDLRATYTPASGRPIPMRGLVGSATKLVLAADVEGRARVRLTLKPDGSGGGWAQIGAAREPKRLGLQRAAT